MRLQRLRQHFALLRALLRTLLAIEHVGARDLMLARAHQREFDLILNVFDMERSAIGLTAHQRGDDRLCQSGDEFANAR